MFEKSQVVWGVCVCVCVPNPVPKGMFTQVVMHAELKNRGQQGVHSSAANEDSCEYSVKQIETSICVPVSLISLHRSSKRLSSEPQKDQVCSEFFFRSHFPSCFLSNIFTRRKKSMKIEEQNMKCSSMPFLYLGRYKRQGVWQHYG